jgi:hypothetical protein
MEGKVPIPSVTEQQQQAVAPTPSIQSSSNKVTSYYYENKFEI